LEFIGRKNEMRRLEELKAKDAASLVVITGRSELVS
jgi:AAA+ ATPase superfamily predicted ATPase